LQVSAHPKYDYATNETFFHGHDLAKQRFYVGRIVDGRLADLVDLEVSMGFHHDMFITKDYVVIIDGSMNFSPESVPKKLPIWNYDPQKKLRFGILPRAAKFAAASFIWVEAGQSAEIVHTLFGQNDGTTIELWTPVVFHDPSASNDSILGAAAGGKMHRIVIDVAARTARIHEVEGGNEFNTEFPRVRDDRVGLTARYGFSALQHGNGFNFTGIIKWDFEAQKRVGVIQFGHGVVGGEPVFIPHGDGDDSGFISMFLWNLEKQTSTFVLYNATSFSSIPTVELGVPHRVPLGFHGWWVSQESLRMQPDAV